MEKAGLKLNLQKTKIMASSPITSWQMDGEKVETVTDFIFLGSKITVDGDSSHEIKRRLPGGLDGKESACNARDLGWKRPLEEGKATHSSIFAWRIPVDRGAKPATVHGVAKSQTRLSI